MTTRAATPAKRLTGPGDSARVTTDHSAVRAKNRRFSPSHKTRGRALSCVQPIPTLQSGKKGGDVGVGGRGDHALAFWFTTILEFLGDLRGRYFLKLRRENELLRTVDSRLIMFWLVKEEKEFFWQKALLRVPNNDCSLNAAVNNVIYASRWARKLEGSMESLTTRAGRGLEVYKVTTPSFSVGEIELRKRNCLFSLFSSSSF